MNNHKALVLETDELERRHSKIGWRYHREVVRARARKYWPTAKLHRAIPPEWLVGAT